jgi:hypothetical protein
MWVYHLVRGASPPRTVALASGDMRLALSIGVSILLSGCGGTDASIFNDRGDAAPTDSAIDETSVIDTGRGSDSSVPIDEDDGPPPFDSASPPVDSGTGFDTAPPLLDVGVPGCIEGGGKPYGGHCYFTTMPRSWVAARDECAMYKAHLVTISTAAEQAFVNSFASGDRWIGLFRPEGSPVTETSYRWVTTEPVTYTNWDPSEPNFSGSCVRLRSDGAWADNSCSTNLTAICERE